jgi:quinol monooxygenase YgiN
MRFDSDTLAHALDAIRPVVEATRQEPGNVAYRYYRDLDDPTTLFLFEEWESEDALEQHFQMPYVIDFVAAMASYGILDAAVHRYEVGEKSQMG